MCGDCTVVAKLLCGTPVPACVISWFLDSKTVSGVSSNWEAEGMRWGWPGVVSENLMTAECMGGPAPQSWGLQLSSASTSGTSVSHGILFCLLFARSSLSHMMHCDGFARGTGCSV